MEFDGLIHSAPDCKLLCGQLEDRVLIQQILDLGPIDMIVADPPDNLGLNYDICDDKKPTKEYHRLMSKWLSVLRDLTDGPIFLTFNDRWTGLIEALLVKLDIPLIQRCYWYYTFGQNQRTKYSPCTRPVYWLNNPFILQEAIKIPSARQTKYNDKRAASGGKMPDNVFCYPRVCGTFKSRRKWHPTQLNQDMVERWVAGHCKADGTVLDPFHGSGTTMRAAKNLGRHYVGVDISRNYLLQSLDD